MSTSQIDFSEPSRAAHISDCGRFRYTLERRIGSGDTLLGVMLNPSIADASIDDPTVRKVIGFTSRACYGKALVVNLFAYRATDPKVVRAMHADEAEGEGNHAAIEESVARSSAIVRAWGAQPWAKKQAERVLRLVNGCRGGRPLYCIGRTKEGYPLHPLMQAYALGLSPFERSV